MNSLNEIILAMFSILFMCSVQEMASLYPDRVITIHGRLEDLSNAQTAISVKLAECYERDLASLNRVIEIKHNVDLLLYN